MSASRSKLLMTGLMVLDHISYLVPPEWALIFHIIACRVGVFFGCMVVGDFNYTRNVYRCNGRLYIWTAIMFVRNTLLNHLANNPTVAVHNNTLFTLALGVGMLIVVKSILEIPKISLRIVLLISILAILEIGAMSVKGGIMMLPLILVTYLTRKRLVLRNCLYGALALFFLVTGFQWLGDWPMTIEMLAYNSDFMFITVLPLMSLYNDERGSKTPFFEYLFYGLYPLHLQLITSIANYVYQTFLY